MKQDLKVTTNINIWSYASISLDTVCRPYGLIKILKKCHFPCVLNKSWKFGVLHKTRLVDDHQTFTLGIMQLFNTMQQRGNTTTSMTTFFLSLTLIKLQKCFCFHCIARPLHWAQNLSVSVLEKWPLKVSKHLWAPS